MTCEYLRLYNWLMVLLLFMLSHWFMINRMSAMRLMYGSFLETRMNINGSISEKTLETMKYRRVPCQLDSSSQEKNAVVTVTNHDGASLHHRMCMASWASWLGFLRYAPNADQIVFPSEILLDWMLTIGYSANCFVFEADIAKNKWLPVCNFAIPIHLCISLQEHERSCFVGL